MRRDTQIGIILGIVILVIIGVFLSTRTSDTETVIPDLVLSEEGRQKSEIEEIDISEIIKESKKAEPEEPSSVVDYSNEAKVSEEIVKSTQPDVQPEETSVETLKDDTSLEGKWEGITEEVAEEIVEESEIVGKPEIIRESVIAEKTEIKENAEIEQRIPSSEETVIPEKEQQVASYGASTKTIYKVQANDNLFKIARKYYGDGEKWTRIFDANKDNMLNPDSLYVGQKLLIPDIIIEEEKEQAFQTPDIIEPKKEKSAAVDTHTVEAGDTLYRLAEQYYDDPNLWIRIYEANEDEIEDKGLLKVGQTLIIPEL